MRWLVLAVMAVAPGCRVHFDAIEDAEADAADAADADVPLCARATTLVCEDYDAGIGAPVATAGDYSWLPTGGRSGGALRVRGTTIMGGYADYRWATPVTAGSLYARVYARVLGGPQVQDYVVLLELNNDVFTGGIEKVSADISGGDYFAMAVPFSGLSSTSSAVAARDAWTCIALAIDVDSTAGTVRLLIDGAAVLTEVGNTLVPGGFLLGALSVSIGNGDVDTEVWYDDFVVATEPLGC